MAWSFGDSFDLYAAIGDMTNGYWDALVVGSNSLNATGRFAGSRSLNVNSSSGTFTKSSAVNDGVHHFVVSFQQTSAISGSGLGSNIQLFDGATAQCSIVFRQDGAILLTSGAPGGTVLATYTGAFPVVSTWYAFEIEVVINNTTGSFAVRKNGNTVNDFSLGSLNTRPTSTNNYANKIVVGSSGSGTHVWDDFFWQSGAATGAWLGDIRCYTRMPASDQSVTFSKLISSATQTPFTSAGGPNTYNNTTSLYNLFPASFTGTVNAVTVQVNAGFTGNMKCSVFNDSGGTQPTTVVATATPLVNPVTGANTFTFSTPFSVLKGVNYWVGTIMDGSYASAWTSSTTGTVQKSTTVSYASFPQASPTVAGGFGPNVSWTIAVSNFGNVNEAQQDALTSYVYDSNPGDADFYGIASIAATPATVIATTIRAYMQKSDAGSRTAAVQLKSGSSTVASPTLTLTTSGWLWAWRMDLTDPNTGAAWTATGVNNAQIGVTVTA